MILRKLFFTLCLSVSFIGNSQADTICGNEPMRFVAELSAEEDGNAESQYKVGVMYHECDSDAQEAIRWLRMAAEQGLADAQNYLGWMYYKVLRDDDEAVRWLRIAAEQGHAKAQDNLAWMYGKGEGVLLDDKKAARWYRMAAEQGLANAQYNLGWMYHNGKGVLRDDREAVRWYRMAAEQGHADAQNYLGYVYWNGEGVVKNEYESYIWYSIAKANGSEYSVEHLRENKWHLYLTASEIKSAKREASRRLEEIDSRQARNDNSAPVYASEAPIAITPQNKGIAETVFENTWRSVVLIKTSEAQGSGVIVRPNIVATNCHVIDDGGDIVVFKHDNRLASTDTLFSATVRRRDDENDFCLLDVAGLWGIQASMRKYDTLNIGENVYALGSPKGLDLSLSTGIISQLREGANLRYIQTDAAFSPGSSGGGLFDSQGNLIGILTSKFTTEGAEGLGFAIPADLALVL